MSPLQGPKTENVYFPLNEDSFQVPGQPQGQGAECP